MTDDTPADPPFSEGDDAGPAPDAAPGMRARRSRSGAGGTSASTGGGSPSTGGKRGGRGRGAPEATAADGPAAQGDADADDAAEGPAESVGGRSFKTRELVDRVAKAAGMRRRAAKPVVEMVLAELATALQEGRPMSLRPLGKITVARTRARGGNPVLTCRIRPVAAKRAAGATDADPLAQSREGS